MKSATDLWQHGAYLWVFQVSCLFLVQYFYSKICLWQRRLLLFESRFGRQRKGCYLNKSVLTHLIDYLCILSGNQSVGWTGWLTSLPNERTTLTHFCTLCCLVLHLLKKFDREVVCIGRQNDMATKQKPKWRLTWAYALSTFCGYDRANVIVTKQK